MRLLAVILAAGNGTRFEGASINKTATLVGGKSLVQIGIENISQMVEKIVVVVGFKKETVIESISSDKVIFAIQPRRLGTGHAVKVALEKIESLNKRITDLFVGNGDHLFMIDGITIQGLLKKHTKERNDVTILTAMHNDPSSLNNGRIIRKNGLITSILEKADCDKKAKLIKELNTGTYVFNYQSIKKILDNVKIAQNKELYITHELLKLKKIGSYTVSFMKVGTGVNTSKELQRYVQSSFVNNL